MSVQKPRADGESVGTDELGSSERATFLPATAGVLLRWLDEQPGFIEVERTYTLRKGEDGWTTGYVSSRRTATAIDRTQHALVHVDADYEPSSRKSFDSQKDVADAWEEMQFPTHNVTERNGRLAAELYTLSSYTTDVEGPSTRRPMYHVGWVVEEPCARVRCMYCQNWKSRDEPTVYDALTGGYRSTSLAEHFREEHPDVELREVTSTRWDCRTVEMPVEPEDHTYYKIEEGKRVTESEQNFAGYQYADGSGELVHYSRTEAIRTRSGLVLNNSQCFAKGRAHCTRPSDYTASLPLTGMQEMLDDEDVSIFDISEVLYDQERIYISGDYDSDTGEWDYSDADVRSNGPKTKDTPVIAVFEDGSGLAIVYDETAQNYHEQRVGFRLAPDQVDSLRQAEDVTERLLKPVEVSKFEAEGGEVVGANTFQFNGTSGFYSERLGEVAVRQGEWYFIPQDEDFEPDAAVYHFHQRGGWDLGPIEGLTQVDGVPAECSECGETSFEVEEAYSLCTGCGHPHVDPSRSDDISGFTPDEEPFDPDALGSHRPSHLAITEDGEMYVRGSVRHIRQEHPMVNFRDIWHRAVENTLDGVVFDTSTPDSTTGRSGGSIARVE